MLESRIADIANAGTSRLAGAITAALYLERFVPDGMPWLHLDVYAWNDAIGLAARWRRGAGFARVFCIAAAALSAALRTARRQTQRPA